MKPTHRGVLAALAVALGVLAWGAVSTEAQAPAGMKLYAFSSGALTLPKSFLQAGAPSTAITVPVGFYVIRHPKGNVLFDTGNNDKIITDPSYWGAFVQGLNPVRTPDVAIDAQLNKIGLKPDDIKYVVVGHMHLDHGGNIGKFPKSTLVVQKDEVRNAFWPEPGTGGPYVPGDFMMLRAPAGSPVTTTWPMIQLDGDLDLFNDQSVVIRRWVGHTPGSQMAIVRLPKTGTIILTSDNVYFADNVTKNLLPDVSLAYKPTGILEAYQWIREMQARENAQFFTAHDPDAFKQMKKAPEFLE
jgi:glyoxylase-like metal-dependent hydrolase (beta-lactamase superfamily II)